MKHFLTTKKITILVVIVILAVFLLPFFVRNETSLTYAVGESCTTPGNIKGICRNRSTTYCSGYYNSGNYCPGGSNIQCCIPGPRSCSPPEGAGVCKNSSGGQAYSCPGHYNSGNYCSGPNDVQCCVAPAATAVPTPATPCGDSAPPSGSIISTGVNTSASSINANDAVSYGPANTVDGIISASTYWNSGGYPPKWIELNLGSRQTVTGLRINVRISAVSTHQIYAGPTANPTTLRRTLNNCTTSAGQMLNVVFPTPLTDVQYIRINTPTSNQWVAWTEIAVYGSAPGAQSQTPGIIFSGDGTTDFGHGDASTESWVVGGANYPEMFPTVARQSETSHQYLTNKIASTGVAVTNLTSLATCINLSNCTLPANLTNGIYAATGNVTLNGYTFPTGKNYIFLIDGNLTIRGNLIVPNGSTAFFSSSSDIIVDRTVGTNTNLFPLPAGQVQGIFSADRDFSIEGINDCIVGPDKMLNFEGAIVTNAFGNGGTFRMKRDLCGDNPNYPSFTVRLRLDMLLNLPEILMKRNTTFREDAP